MLPYDPLRSTDVPRDLYPHVIEFCRSLSQEAPVYLEVRPDPVAVINECPSNVRRHIQSDGGDAITGWQIWEWVGLMIEAEFHQVWRSADGELRDVTPKVLPFPRILFVPDPRLTYDGRQINNIRRALTSDNRVREFIALADRIFAITNSGALAEFHGLLPPDVARESMKLEIEKTRLFDAVMRSEPGRNDLCRCGSGRKYKRCHRS